MVTKFSVGTDGTLSSFIYLGLDFSKWLDLQCKFDAKLDFLFLRWAKPIFYAFLQLDKVDI